MTKGSFWILFICSYMQSAISETPEELLLALKQKYAQQPDCTPEFEIRHPGYISPDAAAHPSITTDEECASACIMDEDCMSYQIDSRPGEPFCRLQSSYSLENLLGPFDEVKEHVFTVKCVISTSEGQCTPLIEARLRNWNSHRGREQLSVGSEMECRALCFDDQDCMSYHIDHISGHPLCYIQKDLEMFHKDLLYMGREVTEYFVVDRCLEKYEVSHDPECSPVFKKLHEKVSNNATPYPFLTTEQLCRLRCLFDPDCVSYQIDRNPEAPFCLIQTNGDNLAEGELNECALVTEYILVDSCTDNPLDKSSPDCKPFIIPMQYPGLSVNAEHHSEISRSSDDCQSLCLSTPTCVAFQITSENLDCWIQNDWTKLMPDQARYADELSSEHVVVRKCSKATSSEEAGESTVSADR